MSFESVNVEKMADQLEGRSNSLLSRKYAKEVSKASVQAFGDTEIKDLGLGLMYSL